MGGLCEATSSIEWVLHSPRKASDGLSCMRIAQWFELALQLISLTLNWKLKPKASSIQHMMNRDMAHDVNTTAQALPKMREMPKHKRRKQSHVTESKKCRCNSGTAYAPM